MTSTPSASATMTRPLVNPPSAIKEEASVGGHEAARNPQNRMSSMFSPPPCGDSFFDDMETLPSTLASFKDKSSPQTSFQFKKPEGFASGDAGKPKMLHNAQNAASLSGSKYSFNNNFDDSLNFDLDLEEEIESEQKHLKQNTALNSPTQNIGQYDTQAFGKASLNSSLQLNAPEEKSISSKSLLSNFR